MDADGRPRNLPRRHTSAHRRTATPWPSKERIRHRPAEGLDKRDWIAGLERGVSIIEAFDDANPRLTASQAGQRTNMTRTAARRYLLTLQHMGYVASDGKLFWLTPRVLRLGQSYLESARLPRVVQPFLQRVAAGTNEFAYLSVMDGDEVVYIARNGPNRSMSTGYVLGARVPAQVTASGMLMLALRTDAELAEWLATRHADRVHPAHHREHGAHEAGAGAHPRAGLGAVGTAARPELARHCRAVARPARHAGGRAEHHDADGARELGRRGGAGAAGAARDGAGDAQSCSAVGTGNGWLCSMYACCHRLWNTA
jgi:DNA-binding IclR family transcriptional regulator